MKSVAPSLLAAAALLAWDTRLSPDLLRPVLDLRPWGAPWLLLRHTAVLTIPIWLLHLWWRGSRRLLAAHGENRKRGRTAINLVTIGVPALALFQPLVKGFLLRPRFEAFDFHPLASWAFAFSAGLALAFSALPILRLTRRLTWPVRLVTSLSAAAVCAGVITTDHNWLPNLYANVHFFFVVSALVAGLIALATLAPRGPSSWTSRIACCLILATGIHGFFDLRPALKQQAREERILLLQELLSTSRLTPWLYGRPPAARAPVAASDLSPMRREWQALRSRARQILKPGRRPDVILVTVDAIRADHVGFLGYERDTTPFLDELATKSAVFSNARSAATGSYFSIGSMLSCVTPESIVAARGNRLVTLAERLGDAGWLTRVIFNPVIFGLRPTKWPVPDRKMGFAYADDKGNLAASAVDRMLDWFREANDRDRQNHQDGRPQFYFAHLMDPHYPYDSRPGADFGDQSLDRYDSEIHAADAQLRRLFESWHRLRPNRELIFILSSDHGESFGEKSIYFHAGPPIESQCRVPLLIYDSTVQSPQRFDASVSNASLAPTILDLLHLPPLPAPEYPSLSPLLTKISDGARWSTVVETPFLAQFPHQTARRALVQDKVKIYRDLGFDFAQIFDLSVDPNEDQDITRKKPDLASAMITLEETWYQDIATLRAQRFDRDPSNRDQLKLSGFADSLRARNRRAIGQVREFLTSTDQKLRNQAADLLVEAALERGDAGASQLQFGAAPGDLRNQKLSRALASILGPSKSAATADSGKPPSLAFKWLLESDDDSAFHLAAKILARHPAIEIEDAVLAQASKKTSDRDSRFELDLARGHRGQTAVLPRLKAVFQGSANPIAKRLRAMNCLARFDDDLVWERLETIAEHLGADAIQELFKSAVQNETPRRQNWFRRQLARPDSKTLVLAGLALRDWDQAFRRSIARRVALLEPRPDLRTTALQLLTQEKGADVERWLLQGLQSFGDGSDLVFRIYLERLRKLGERPSPGAWIGDELIAAGEKHLLPPTFALPATWEAGVERRILIAMNPSVHGAQDKGPLIRLHDAAGQSFTLGRPALRGGVLVCRIAATDKIVPPIQIERVAESAALDHTKWTLRGLAVLRQNHPIENFPPEIGAADIPLMRLHLPLGLGSTPSGDGFRSMGPEFVWRVAPDLGAQPKSLVLKVRSRGNAALRVQIGKIDLGWQTIRSGVGVLRWDLPDEAVRSEPILSIRFFPRNRPKREALPVSVDLLKMSLQ